jgi:hypothetical protein
MQQVEPQFSTSFIELLRTAEAIFGKDSPFAGRVFLFPEKDPGLCFRIPCECIVEWTVRIFEDKLDAVAGALTVTDRF